MSIRRDWYQFWFSPLPSGPLGLYRILFGAMVLWYGLLLLPDRGLWFSESGMFSHLMANQINAHTTPMNNREMLRPLNFLNHPLSDGTLLLFFVVFLIAAFLLMVGMWTRVAAILVWVGLNCLHNRNGLINNSGDTMMLVMATYMMLAPAGAACSLDRLRRIMRGREGAEPPPIVPWALRIMQLQVCIVYLCTSLAKSGPLWLNGTAVYYAVRLPELSRFPLPPLGGGVLWIINLVTYGTLAIELALAFLVWVPRLRLYSLAGGVLLHLGIEYSMNIPLFAFLMIVSYTTFLKQRELYQVTEFFRKLLRTRRLRLVYDGECDFCRSIVLAVRFFDVFRLVSFVDYRDPEAMHQTPGVKYEEADEAAIAVDDRGRQHAGFHAFRVLASRLPAFWLLTPLLYLPGMSWIGEKVYRWVARNRSKMPVAPRYQ